MSMVFWQNGLDFALNIEKPLRNQAVYIVWQQSHPQVLHILLTSSSGGSLKASLLRIEVIMSWKSLRLS